MPQRTSAKPVRKSPPLDPRLAEKITELQRLEVMRFAYSMKSSLQADPVQAQLNECIAENSVHFYPDEVRAWFDGEANHYSALSPSAEEVTLWLQDLSRRCVNNFSRIKPNLYPRFVFKKWVLLFVARHQKEIPEEVAGRAVLTEQQRIAKRKERYQYLQSNFKYLRRRLGFTQRKLAQFIVIDTFSEDNEGRDENWVKKRTMQLAVLEKKRITQWEIGKEGAHESNLAKYARYFSKAVGGLGPITAKQLMEEDLSQRPEAT